MSSKYLTPQGAWEAALFGLVDGGPPVTRAVAPRGQATVEYRWPVHLVILQPWRMPLAADGREFRHAITAAEGLSLVGQTSVPEVVVDKVAAFRPFMRNSVFWGAYGPRVAGDVGQVVDLLRRDPDSRQAVLTIFDSDRDLGRVEQVDLPCTVAIQFLLRDPADDLSPAPGRALEMWVQMRSNDAWLGLPYDLGQFTMLQAAVAQALGVQMGVYTHSAGSMHLYDRNLAKARLVRPTPPNREGAFPWPWWGGSGDIGETASRARRILLGQADRLTGVTEFEGWLRRQLVG